MSKLLEIHPRELKFTVELKKQSTCLVRLTNVTSYYVAFKVKTTSPKRYCVRPNVGIVMPNESYDFTVIMQMPRSGPFDLDCKDKFLIQSTTVSAEITDGDITASMFLKDSGNYVEEKKLKVILISPPDSPPLSPINRDLGQGLSRETSFFRDQSPNGVENQPKQHTVTENREEPAVANIKESNASDDRKIKPMKSVLFELDNDVEELKATKDTEEVKPAKHVEVLNPAEEIEELKPVTDVEKLNILKYVEEVKPVVDVEKLNPAKYAEELKPATTREELKPSRNLVEPKQAIDVGFRTAEDFEPNSGKVVELKNAKALEDSKLVKDVEEIKSKLSEFELKLSKAEFTISKLMVERNSNIEERKILQEKFAELSKGTVKTVQVGFPLLFVCMVALISVVIGYRLHP